MESQTADAMTSYAAMKDNTAIVTKFQSLQQESDQLFDDLRHLPQFGQKMWQPYFGKAFSLFTKLWKFQQQHRSTLEDTGVVLKWDVGNIASHIGQLYYHYYLKTSKVAYLEEAFQFYSAIKTRGYYKIADNKDRMIKQLRYYTRFIVVCLLLDKKSKVQELIQELLEKVKSYHETYEVHDTKEWDSVITELKAFSTINCALRITTDDGKPINLTHRCTKVLEKSQRTLGNNDLHLKEALVIGSYAGQVKFSDLTVDSFRFLQLLEYDVCKRSKQDLMNPHKYILYKPTFTQIATFLSIGIQELPADGVMLLYVSANGYTPTKKPQSDEFELHNNGGVQTARPNPSDKTRPIHEPHCLYPEDLLSSTRKPLFVIIESDNSTAFKNVPDVFGQPLLILMSPCSYPQVFQEMNSDGNLLTHFLYSPLEAICTICSVTIVSQQTWIKCQELLDRILDKLTQLCGNCSSLDFRVREFMGDDFLSPLIAKFLFCCSTLYLHQLFKEPSHYPSSYPEFPATKELVYHPSILTSILSLSSLLEVRSLFYELDNL